MKKTAAVILALALLTACGQSTRQQWQIVPQIYGGIASEKTVTLSAELPQGWEAALFLTEDGTRQLALKDENGELGIVTVYRDDGDTYGQLTEDHMQWLSPEDLHEAECTTAKNAAMPVSDIPQRTGNTLSRRRGFIPCGIISCNLTAGWSAPR